MKDWTFNAKLEDPRNFKVGDIYKSAIEMLEKQSLGDKRKTDFSN